MAGDHPGAGGAGAGTIGLEANGLQSKDSFRTKPEAVTGEAVLARHFPAGAGNPVQVIGRAEAAGQLQAALSATPGVTEVTRPQVSDGYACVPGRAWDRLQHLPDDPGA